MAVAWVLNFDSDHELERPGQYSPRAAIRARARALAPRAGLVEPGDVIVDDTTPRGAARGMRGQAWCPTPWALRQLARAGALLPEAPPLAVLQRVNHRRFSAELGQTLPKAAFVERLDEALAMIALPTPSGHWLLKRPFGFSGRGRKIVRCGTPDEHASRWLDASLRRDGLQIEPWVEIAIEVVVHGKLDRDGSFALGEPMRQRCTAQGAWQGCEPLGREEEIDRERLLDEAGRVAEALAQAGYFGPFGIDAFTYRWDGALRFNPRSEINARYTMGWAAGMKR